VRFPDASPRKGPFTEGAIADTSSASNALSANFNSQKPPLTPTIDNAGERLIINFFYCFHQGLLSEELQSYF
jgi:hypothetical protein